MSLFAQTTLITATADSADYQVNGFAVDATTVGIGDLDAWRDAIRDFYDDALAVSAMRGFVQNNHIVKVYDITLPQPNYPIYESTFNLSFASPALDLPMEVSLCVSYKNNVLNSVPRARRRGRIYLSGWAESVNTSGRPIASAYEGLADAYAAYVAAVNAIPDFQAGVWSRTDGVVYPIDEVWCDNEWDIQRRRGGQATTRYSLPV